MAINGSTNSNDTTSPRMGSMGSPSSSGSTSSTGSTPTASTSPMTSQQQPQGQPRSDTQSTAPDPSKDKGLASHAKEVATHVSDKARSLVSSEISATQKRSTRDLGSVARALRSTKKDLGNSPASPIVDVAADQIERASRFLQQASVGDVIDEIETFARREPLLFLGGAFALGIFGARFLKSTGQRESTRSEAFHAEPRP